jgi:hypothetical protein
MSTVVRTASCFTPCVSHIRYEYGTEECPTARRPQLHGLRRAERPTALIVHSEMCMLLHIEGHNADESGN